MRLSKFLILSSLLMSSNTLYAGCDVPELANIKLVKSTVSVITGDLELKIHFPNLRNHDCTVALSQVGTQYAFRNLSIGVYVTEVNPSVQWHEKKTQNYTFTRMLITASVDPEHGAKFKISLWGSTKNLIDNMLVNEIDYVIGPKLKAGVATLKFGTNRSASATFELHTEEQK